MSDTNDSVNAIEKFASMRVTRKTLSNSLLKRKQAQIKKCIEKRYVSVRSN